VKGAEDVGIKVDLRFPLERLAKTVVVDNLNVIGV
jgi:hypothetical protein